MIKVNISVAYLYYGDIVLDPGRIFFKNPDPESNGRIDLDPIETLSRGLPVIGIQNTMCSWSLILELLS